MRVYNMRNTLTANPRLYLHICSFYIIICLSCRYKPITFRGGEIRLGGNLF